MRRTRGWWRGVGWTTGKVAAERLGWIDLDDPAEHVRYLLDDIAGDAERAARHADWY